MTSIRSSSPSSRLVRWAVGGSFTTLATRRSETQNPLAREADCGYKMAIGMYSFTWDE
jgi:hypothetical protein